jgi:hypothetical protein
MLRAVNREGARNLLGQKRQPVNSAASREAREQPILAGCLMRYTRKVALLILSPQEAGKKDKLL